MSNSHCMFPLVNMLKSPNYMCSLLKPTPPQICGQEQSLNRFLPFKTAFHLFFCILNCKDSSDQSLTGTSLCLSHITETYMAPVGANDQTAKTRSNR